MIDVYKCSVLLAGVLIVTGCSKAPTQLDKLKQKFAEMEAAALAEEYSGIVNSDGKTPGLFPVAATGVDTLPIIEAAQKLLASLTKQQLERTTFPINDSEWRKWSNVDNGIYDRQGVSLKEMDQQQRNALFALMRSSLSVKGMTLSRNIMKTDQTLKELNDDPDSYDEQLYFLTIMGTPSSTEPWGWQFDGHHLIINFFVLGDQVVMTPIFMGGEPIQTTSGKYKGNVILQEEQNAGLALAQSLDIEQRVLALSSPKKGGTDMVASANMDNLVLDYTGIPASELSATQRRNLRELIALYIANMREPYAKIKMTDVEKHLDQTYFTWIGDMSDDGVFYYRIHGPTVLIEFDHQAPVGVPGSRNREQATRNHIHTIVRTPNGNDYGKDYLRQHLATHAH
tara:strand:+ start:12777 stop:13967 length:1191 start_codon:yes stop_codon:yes gene_type:complete